MAVNSELVGGQLLQPLPGQVHRLHQAALAGVAHQRRRPRRCDVQASSSVLNLNAVASSTVSPSSTASTRAISLSGVHCRFHFSAQVADCCRVAQRLGEADAEHAQPVEERRAVQVEERRLLAISTRRFSRRSSVSSCLTVVRYFSSLSRASSRSKSAWIDVWLTPLGSSPIAVPTSTRASASLTVEQLAVADAA